jgi:hypothetical protein
VTTPTEPLTPQQMRVQPVPPWGSTVEAALSLLPDAVLHEARPTTATGAPATPGSTPPAPGQPGPQPSPYSAAQQAGARPVYVADAYAWAQELSATVSVRLRGWQQLSNTPVVEDDLSPRAFLALEARRLVHSGLAHYIEAARTGRAPGAGQDATASYARILWDRFSDGLDDLVAFLARELAVIGDTNGDGIPDGAQGAQGAQPAAYFPPPAFTRGTGF